MNNDTRPFAYIGGKYLDNIRAVYNTPKGNILDGVPFQIQFDSGSIQFNPDDANRILIELATALYDSGHLSMDTAEQIQYLSSSVLADAVYTGGE